MANPSQTTQTAGQSVAFGARALPDAMGRRGPWVLLGGVGLGLIAPPLARAAYPLMGAAVFVFTFGAFMKVDGAGLRAEFACPRRVILALAWITFGVPLVAFAVARLAIANPDRRRVSCWPCWPHRSAALQRSQRCLDCGHR